MTIATQRLRDMYKTQPSLAQFLPYLEYDVDSGFFLLEDGKSVAAVFELMAPGTEARPDSFMINLRDQLQQVLTDSVKEDSASPWILQFYVQDDPNLASFQQQLNHYIATHNPNQEDQLAKNFVELMQTHIHRLSQPNGLFLDERVTGNRFRGLQRRIRLIVYRRLVTTTQLPQGMTPVDDLKSACQTIVSTLKMAGVQLHRVDGQALYDWLLTWFNPAPKLALNVNQVLYAGEKELPYGHDFTEQLFLSAPYSDKKTGIWYFDNIPHQVITLQGLRRAPQIGHITAEREQADKRFTLFDRLPPGSIFVMTVVIKPQHDVLDHIHRIKKSAVGDTAESVLTREEADHALLAIAKRNNIYPTQCAVYIKAANEQQLRQAEIETNTLLISNGLTPIDSNVDLIAQDSYIKNLPMVYDPKLEENTKRARLMYASHIANCLPLYGRTRGTGHPGITFYNRGGEPLTFDPLNKHDRMQNGHLLLLGPTGSGKSATGVYLMLQLLAVHNPRLFIIEAGNSFGLLGDYLSEQGKTVHKVKLSPNNPISLNPFADAMKVLAQVERLSATDIAITLNENVDAEVAELNTTTESANANDAIDTQEARDYLGEMAIAAQIMISGGEKKEDDKITRQDKLTIRKAILFAAQTVKANGYNEVLTQDVVAALRHIATESEGKKKERAIEMADGLDVFCTDQLAASFFNVPGNPWPVCDVTILDLGHLVRDGYEDQLAVAYLGVMNRIMALAERNQHDRRSTIVLTDESHIITTNPLLAPVNVKNAKMARKLGLWFWYLTQNLSDFPNEARKMLTLIEWWLCLAMEKDEVEQVARFKNLTDEQWSLFLSAKKSPGQYTEGVVMSGKVQGLFRNVPPPLCLALAMTEQHEKHQRQQLMQQYQCSEVEAAKIIANKIDAT